jgi:GNAT superfamily N-acetyltransferase
MRVFIISIILNTHPDDVSCGLRYACVVCHVGRNAALSDCKDDESGESDPFIATSDEILPHSARAPRAPGSRPVGKGTAGAKRKGARAQDHPAGGFEDEDSPLKTRYIRGATPPPLFYGTRSWIEALEEEEQKHREQVQPILSGRDLPLRVTTLHWPRLQQVMSGPQSFRQVLQRFFDEGHSLRLPPYLVDNGPVSPVRMRTYLEALALDQSVDGCRRLSTDGHDLLPHQAGQVVEGWDHCGMLLWGSGGGIVEQVDDVAHDAVGKPDLHAAPTRVGGGRGADCNVVLAEGVLSKKWCLDKQSGLVEGNGGKDVLEKQDERESKDEDWMMMRDVCVDARTQLLQRADAGDAEASVRRYVSSRMWAGDQVVREQIWEVFSANAVKETVRQVNEYETVTKKYYHIDDEYELQWERERKRADRQGTDCYVGPGGKRPELYRNDISSFFSHMSLADVVVPVPQGRARQLFLPGRQDVERIQKVAFSKRRASAEAEEISAMHKRSLRGQWPGIPPRGLFEKVLTPPLQNSSGSQAQRSKASEHVQGAGIGEKGGGGKGDPGNVGVGSDFWRQHVKGLGAFVLALGDEFANVASMIARQSASQMANDTWSSTTQVEWLADAPPPRTSALVCLRLDAEPVMGFVAAQCPDAAEALLAQMLPRLTAEWADKSFLLTYPRAFHDGIEQVLTHGARLPKHWLQPVSLYVTPDSGPSILWNCLHPSVNHNQRMQRQQFRDKGGGNHVTRGRAGPCNASGSAHPITISAGAAYDALRRVSMCGRLVPANSLCSAAAALAAGYGGSTLAGDCGAGQTRRTMRMRRVRVRPLEAQDVRVVAAHWMFASETAVLEVARLISTRRCVGVEVEEVAPEDVQAKAAAGDDADAIPPRERWFYWLEPCTQNDDEATRQGHPLARDAAVCEAGEDVDANAAVREETRASVPSPGLVSWALEDEAGGVGMVYTAVSWRRKGLGRWALSRLLDSAHSDFLLQRRCACVFACVRAFVGLLVSACLL